MGSRESLAAAFQAGADSVYFGIGTLNMRSKSANEFTIDDLKEIASLCAEPRREELFNREYGYLRRRFAADETNR